MSRLPALGGFSAKAQRRPLSSVPDTFSPRVQRRQEAQFFILIELTNTVSTIDLLEPDLR